MLLLPLLPSLNICQLKTFLYLNFLILQSSNTTVGQNHVLKCSLFNNSKGQCMVISAFVMFRNTEIDMYKILVFLKELFKMRHLLET